MTISKVRLDPVFTDPFGRSASDIMAYLIHTAPEDVCDEEILRLVHPRVKASGKEILDSIHGYGFIGVQRDKLEIIQKHLGGIDECIRMIDAKLEHYRQKYARIIGHLATMIGITGGSALYILGEIGADMSVWRDSRSLASWAGLAPASNESGGKKRSTKVGKGGHYSKPLLVQCALAAIKSTEKEPYFYHKYITLKKRRGHRKAIIAIARKMLAAIYHMIRNDGSSCPADHDKVTANNAKKHAGWDLENVIAFLGKHGASKEMLRNIEAQCPESRADAEAETTEERGQKEKQSSSDNETEALSGQETVKKKRMKKSCPTKNPDPSKQPAPITSTA